MEAVPLPVPASLLAPDFARRVGVIIAAVVALIARRFLAEPRLVALIVPLGNRLNHTARRFERLMTRLAAGKLPSHRTAARPHRRLPPPCGRRVFPAGRGWLVRVLGWEAAGYGSQLQHLLDEPGVADLLEATPAAQRLLRSIRHMLGVGPTRRRPRESRPHEVVGGRQSAIPAHDGRKATNVLRPAMRPLFPSPPPGRRASG